jgi:hypothetical protein
MRVPFRFLLLAGVVTALAVVGGVLALGGQDDEGPARNEPRFTTTALAGYDTSDAVVSRGPFCDAVDDRQVEAVLGDVPDALAWSNGDELDIAGHGRPDVVHEFGCRYAVQDVGQAQAWVFAPPVDATRAARLVASAKKAAGCQAGTGPAFGSPTLVLTCQDEAGATRASYRGLFGDAWLVCEVELTDSTVDVVDVAGRWCVAVVQAAGGADL